MNTSDLLRNLFVQLLGLRLEFLLAGYPSSLCRVALYEAVRADRETRCV